MSRSHRSRLATGFFWLLTQPRFNHPSHHRSRKQLTTYVESLTTSTLSSIARSASRTAEISMRWLVVWAAGRPRRPQDGGHPHARVGGRGRRSAGEAPARNGPRPAARARVPDARAVG